MKNFFVGLFATVGTFCALLVPGYYVYTSIKTPNRDNASAVQKGSEITIKTEIKTESIPYDVQTIYDNALEYGKTAILNEGSKGKKTYKYKITYKNGEEQSRELISEEITEQPVNKVIAVGTKVVWHCRDVTSYNKNPYDDNECTSSKGEIRLVPDSEARLLDPTYVPGQSGHPWYNSK